MAAGRGRRRRPRPLAPATASARCRRCCSLSSPSQRSLSSPSQQMAHAAATSRALVCVAVVDLFLGNLPKAYQIMRNDATWKMNRYLCSVKIHVTMGVSRSQILLQIRNIAKPRNVHEKFIGAISSGEFAVKYSQVIKTPCAIEAKIHATENLKDTNQRVGVTFYHVL